MTQQAKRKFVIHLRVVRPGPFGGQLTTSLCKRLRVLGDGMNISDNKGKVNCAFCRATMAKAEGR